MDKESITYIIKESEITTTAKAIEFIRDDWKIVSPSLFPFAAGLDGGFFIEMKGKAKGSVFYIATDDPKKMPVLLADNFDLFIKNLELASSFDL